MAAFSVRLSLCRRIFRDLAFPRSHFHRYSYSSVTGNPQADKALNVVTGGRIGGWLERYENVVGLTEVREAQEKVIGAEQKFLKAQTERRSHQDQTGKIHAKLKGIHAQLDKVQRGDARYLALLTEEYNIMKEESDLEAQITIFEQQERDYFASLSSAVRESHERERVRTERTKYWSIIGSIIGACLGILGTSINNYLRMRQLRGLVTESTAGGVEMKGVVFQLSETMQNQHNQLQGFVKDLTNLLGPLGVRVGSETKKMTPVKDPLQVDSSAVQLEAQTKSIIDTIHKQDDTLEKEMNDIKRILAASKASDKDGVIVYVGPEMEALLARAESNLETKIKLNGLWTVAFIYGALAITVPLLFSIFKGS